MSRFLGSVLLLIVGCGGGTELSVNESLTTQTWEITSYRTGGTERIENGEGCLKDDVYTFADDGTASVDIGALCPDAAGGIYPHVTTGTWDLDAEGFFTMTFTSATRADCAMTFTGHLESGQPSVTLGFSQPCSNTVAALELAPQ